MKLPVLFPAVVSIAHLSSTVLAAPPEAQFQAITIDAKIQIGYGTAVADVDGDKLPDILLADKRQIVWYRNPGPSEVRAGGAWPKFVIAENLTKNDHVCLAAEDIDGDGKCELAVGAEWNPGDTEKSGAVFYLIAPNDRTQPWTPVKFPAVEPTTHRMKWIKQPEGRWDLLVVPLHGRGNKNGQGAPVQVLAYRPPTPLNDPAGEWKPELVSKSMHMTHNFDLTTIETVPALLLGGAEGFWKLGKVPAGSRLTLPTANSGELPAWPAIGFVGNDGGMKLTKGVGEIRQGRTKDGGAFVATVEPMHGDSLAVYWGPENRRTLLSDKLTEAHALSCGDLLGIGSDQIVVGWRGNPGRPGSTVGVALWTPLDPAGEKWRETPVDLGGMACEDLVLADLDGDARLDIVAAGRATKNLKLYLNTTK